MTKFDFIENLKRALTGKINPSELADTILYYEDYIDGEIRKGEREEEVLARLGDPRLLAKSIMAANHTESEREDKIWSEDEAGRNKGFRFKEFKVPIWGYAIIAVLVLLLVFSLATRIIWFFMPFIIPIVIVVYLIRIFKRR